MEKAEKISGVIQKKGRKYFKVVLDKTTNGYQHQVLINDPVKDLQVGDRIETYAMPTWAYGHNTGKPYVALYTPVSVDELNNREIQRWYGYVKEAYANGYIYEKGVEKLEELHATEQLENVKKMRFLLEYNKKLQKALKYCTQYKKIDYDSVNFVKKYGQKEDIAKLEEAINQMNKEKEQEAEAKRKQAEEKANKKRQEEEQLRKEGMKKNWNVDADVIDQWSSYCNGQYFIYKEDVYKILKRSNLKNAEKIYGEDAMSFGFLQPFFYTVDVQKVTDSNDPDVLIFKEIPKTIDKLNKTKHQLLEKQKTLCNTIERGAKIKNYDDYANNFTDQAQMLWNTQDIYGGGTKCFVNNGRIYYVIHNTRDGDNWSVNTISGVGYGYSIPANERNMKLVNEYFNLQKQVKELEKALH